MLAPNSRGPSGATPKLTRPPSRARSDSPSETLKRSRSRLTSTIVASTVPVRMNWPVSTVRVLITPVIGGLTSARLWS